MSSESYIIFSKMSILKSKVEVAFKTFKDLAKKEKKYAEEVCKANDLVEALKIWGYEVFNFPTCLRTLIIMILGKNISSLVF